MRPSFVLSILISLLLTGPVQAESLVTLAQQCGESAGMANSLPALSLAAATDVDYIHFQLALTQDDQVIVTGSPILSGTTDVQRLFPERKRDDGKYYTHDFTLAEIRQLHRLGASSETSRIPQPSFAIATLSEYLALVRYLETRLNKAIGIAPEILEPEFYLREQKDISQATLAVLQKFNYLSKADRIFLCSQDGDELQRIATQLMPPLKMDVQLMQMIGAQVKPSEKEPQDTHPDSSGWTLSRLGVKVLGRFASAVAIDVTRLVDNEGELLQDEYVKSAHTLGLKIFASNLADTSSTIPPFTKKYPDLLTFLRDKAGVDGLLTFSLPETLTWQKKENQSEKKQ